MGLLRILKNSFLTKNQADILMKKLLNGNTLGIFLLVAVFGGIFVWGYIHTMMNGREELMRHAQRQGLCETEDHCEDGAALLATLIVSGDPRYRDQSLIEWCLGTDVAARVSRRPVWLRKVVADMMYWRCPSE